MKIIPLEAGERARANVVMGPNGCHISTYATRGAGCSPKAVRYAAVSWKDPDTGKWCSGVARRAAWTAVHGQIPEGMTIDHVCREPRCVRVDHLRLLTRSENARRNYGRDYPEGQSCERGHPPKARIPAHRGKGAGLVCRECKREKWHAWKRDNPDKYLEYTQRAYRVRKERQAAQTY